MILQRITRALSIVIVIGFTIGIVRILLTADGSQSQLIFFGLLIGLAYVGLAGLTLDRPVIGIVCGVILTGLGFFQFSLFPYLFPAGLVLLVDGIGSFVPSPASNQRTNNTGHSSK